MRNSRIVVGDIFPQTNYQSWQLIEVRLPIIINNERALIVRLIHKVRMLRNYEKSMVTARSWKFLRGGQRHVER